MFTIRKILDRLFRRQNTEEECRGHGDFLGYVSCNVCNPRRYSLSVCFGLTILGLDWRWKYNRHARALADAVWVGALSSLEWIRQNFPEAAEIIERKSGLFPKIFVSRPN